ncbi:hypothetical protein IW138_001065 [Coemansia sp. RSA 986]|nr:hypothetical protein IW138_001065 [Coemansia sp. RSA 986]
MGNSDSHKGKKQTDDSHKRTGEGQPYSLRRRTKKIDYSDTKSIKRPRVGSKDNTDDVISSGGQRPLPHQTRDVPATMPPQEPSGGELESSIDDNDFIIGSSSHQPLPHQTSDARTSMPPQEPSGGGEPDSSKVTPEHRPRVQEPLSPSKVSGRKILVGGDFETLGRGSGIVVDKTLICKALFEAKSSPICICLPRRCGKTFSLSIVEKFFNVLNNDDGPVVDGRLDEAECRRAREEFFKNRLLFDTEREFYDEHFCKYPVIRIDLKNLASFLKKQYRSKYIVLLDEYDVPLTHIQGQPWGNQALKVYARLLSSIFKGNDDLLAGMLVGVHHVNVATMTSGVNNIKYMSLAADTDPVVRSANPNDLSLYFGYSEEEIVLLIQKAREVNGGKLGEDSPSDAEILETMREWYNGYRIGTQAGKYNPLASIAFLEELARPRTRFVAAKLYWGSTGGSGVVNRVVFSNLKVVTDMAVRLIQEYKNPSLSPRYAVETPYPPAQGSTSVSTKQIRLGDPSFPANPDPLCTESELVTLFLYTGYLTLGDSNTIRIPDGELLKVWENMLQMAIYNSEDTKVWNTEREELLQGFCNGDMRMIYKQFNYVLQRLSNNTYGALEAVSADIFRTFILTKLELGHHVPGQPVVVTTIEGESGSGKYDWRLLIPGELVGRENAVAVTIKFKRITPKKGEGTATIVRQAHQALRQIIENEYINDTPHTHRRVDIGIANGAGKVAIKQRVWRRPSPEELEAARNESRDFASFLKILEEKRQPPKKLNKRIADLDDRGWVDLKDWVTEPLDNDTRV